MDYNKKLSELYNSKIDSLINLFSELNNSEIESDKDFSWPLLIHVWEEEYEKAPVKLMVFGQETNGWDNHTESRIERNTAETLINEYKLHNMGRHRMSSPFWRTVHLLNNKLGNPDSNCFVWNNILKFGKECGSGNPSDHVIAAEMKYLNIIADEVKILQPDVCVFLTGPNYDSDIKNKFPDVEFLPVEGFEPNWLVQVKSEYLPKTSFRTYHPQYGNTKNDIYRTVLEKIVALSKLQ